MVEAVKNSTQVKDVHAYNAEKGINSGAGQISHANNRENSLFRHENDYGNYGNRNIDLGRMEADRIRREIYGPIAYNPRLMNAFQQQMRQQGHNYENQSITNEDQNNLQPLADRLDEYRIFGMRTHHKSDLVEDLEEAKKSGIGVGLYLTNCAKDGLKDPNKPISFANLKNPLRLVNTLKSVDVNTPDANDKINLLSDIAIKQRSAEMAACLLEGTSEGGATGAGVDAETAKKLLIESRSMFKNEQDYNKFITDIDKAYKKLFNGKSLDKYIKQNYKPTEQKVAATVALPAGMAIGRAFGAKGAVVGAAVGAVVGLSTYATNFFGKNEVGNELMSAVTNARQNSHDVDISKHNSGGTIPLGALSGASRIR